MKKTPKRGIKAAKHRKKNAPYFLAPGEGYVIVKKEYLSELLAVKKHLKKMERILKSGRLDSL
ncbi:MAG: hypothetical protein HY098_04730 [Nitrospinae bacterium]|nr:hypothetical protein [Nitrospinota bacterium]